MGLGKVVDKITQEQIKTYFFVMTMPYSGYMYVEAFPDMKQLSCIQAHNHAYRFFGGVPTITVIDNLRTGVTKADRFEPTVNEIYQQMADHYGTTIVPTKVYSLKGKAQVERTVKIVETWIIAYLRKTDFPTFTDLNEAVLERVGELNAQVVVNRDTSREQLFFADEKEALLPLPKAPFEMATWKKAKLQQDSHFQLEYMRYSVPYAYIGEELDLRITADMISVYVAGELICSHAKLKGRIGQYSTDESHMPEHLRTSTNKLWSKSGFIDWAKRVGPCTERAVSAIIGAKPIVEQSYRSCRGLKSLGDKKGSDILEEACRRALELAKVPSYTQIRNLAGAIDSEPVIPTLLDELVDGEVGSVGYLRDPKDYAKGSGGAQ